MWKVLVFNGFRCSLLFGINLLLMLSFFACASRGKKVDLPNEEIKLEKVFNLDEGKYGRFLAEPTNQNEIIPIKKKKRKNSNKIASSPKKPLLEKKLVDVKLEEKDDRKGIFYPPNFPPAYIKYDQESQKIWKIFSPLIVPNEKIRMDIQYFGVSCGTIVMETLNKKNLGGKEVYHFKAQLTSSDYYKYIYSLDDIVESFIDAETFLPVKFSMVQRESGQTVDDLQIFDDEKRTTHFWYKRLKRGEEKKEEKSELIPKYFQDSISALLFVRGLPLKNGDIYEFPIVTRTKVWLLKAEVEKRITIGLEGKEIEAIQIKAETRFPGILSKKGDIIFWYSNDSQRKLLKFVAKVKIGSISGEILPDSL